jgi:hypothetical protein
LADSSGITEITFISGLMAKYDFCQWKIWFRMFLAAISAASGPMSINFGETF